MGVEGRGELEVVGGLVLCEPSARRGEGCGGRRRGQPL